MQINQQLQTAIENLKKVDFELLSRQELGVDYNFKREAGLLKSIWGDLEKVCDNADKLETTKQIENEVVSLGESLNRLIIRIKTFAVKGNEPNASNQQRDIINSIDNLNDEKIKILKPLLNDLTLQRFLNKSDFDEIKKQRNQAKKSSEEIEKIRQKIEELQNGAAIAVKEIRDKFGKEGARISGNDFKNQAQDYKDAANKWLKAAAMSIVGAIILVLYLFTGLFGFVPYPSLEIVVNGAIQYDNNPTKLIQITAFKLFLLSFLYIFIQQSIKNYRINQHLYVLNKHRQLTLSVYQLMLEATANPEQSNIILAQAAKAIFEAGSTGYLQKDDTKNPINLTEVINGVVDKKI